MFDLENRRRAKNASTNLAWSDASVMNSELIAAFGANGYVLLPRGLTPFACDDVVEAINRVEKSNGDRRGGIRNVFQHMPEVRVLVRSSVIRAIIEPILGHNAFAVRAILFDKVPQANWRVPWHRDMAIAVRGRIDVPGFSGWSIKEGVVHVEAPREVLDRMLSIRLHLDPVDEDNGPLRVIPGSHGEPVGAVKVDDAQAVTLTCAQGSVLLMRPLLMHASSPAKRPAHRRVLHLEFAAHDLSGGLEWYERW